MAYAKELTIALGQTVYAGDSESDERVTSQEVRVEVTYVLERDDMDVPLLANVKAAEVQHALVAARQQLRRQEAAETRSVVPPASNGQGLGGNSPFKPGAGTAGSPASARPYGTGTRQGNGYARTQSPAAAVQESQEECITQAQKLAIRSMFTRLSLNEPDARALVHEQFGKWALDALTKEEGKQLLQALQQDEREQTGREPAAH